jgi:hypothetical protein
MKKTGKSQSGKRPAKGSTVPNGVARDPKTGETFTIKGFGALKDSDFKIDGSIDLLKPIAEQVFAKRSQKRKAV